MITLKQSPEPDQHLIRFCGECITFSLELSELKVGKAYLRTNLNKSDIRYEEIIKLFDGKVKIINMIRDGRDVITSMHPNGKGRYWVTKDRWIEDNKSSFKITMF